MIDLRTVDFVQTCGACPSQWQAEATEDHPAVYIRYRWGSLSISTGRTIHEALMAEPIFYVQHGDDLDGFIELEEVLRLFEQVNKTTFTRAEVVDIIDKVTAENLA